MALAERLKEQAGLCPVEWQVADLIEDQGFWMYEFVHFRLEAVVGEGLRESPGSFHGVGEVGPVSHLAREDAERDGQVGLTDARRS